MVVLPSIIIIIIIIIFCPRCYGDGFFKVVITRIIASEGRLKSLRQALRELVDESGIAGLYKGSSAYVSLSSSSSSSSSSSLLLSSQS